MNKIAWHINSLFKALRFALQERAKIVFAIPEKQPAVYFHFTRLDYRFYLPIIRAFHGAGYYCYINFNYKFISSGTNFLNWIQDLDRVYFCPTEIGLKNCSLLIRDAEKTDLKTTGKIITISDQIYDKHFKPKKVNVLPFAMHPEQYLNFEKTDKEKLRRQSRKFRLFFSGNVSEEGYKDEIINELHHKLSRNQLIEILTRQFNGALSHTAAISPEAAYQNKIVLLTSNFWVNDTVKQHTIKKSDWFKYLAATDFFLAMPGFSHSMCHNLIESMAVGCIPVLEHAEYLSPALEDGVNCIAFKGEADFITKVNQVLNMPAAKILEMRENVIAYYETFLASAYIVKEFEKAADRTTFYYYSSAQSVELYYKKFKKQHV